MSMLAPERIPDLVVDLVRITVNTAYERHTSIKDFPAIAKLERDLVQTVGPSCTRILRAHGIPVRAERSLRAAAPIPHTCSGINTEILRNMIELLRAVKGASCDTNAVTLFPVAVSLDSMGLSTHVELDEYRNMVTGVEGDLSVTDLRSTIAEQGTVSWARDTQFVHSALVVCVSAMTGEVSLPVGAFYDHSRSSSEDFQTAFDEIGRGLGQCLRCLKANVDCTVPEDNGPCNLCSSAKARCVRLLPASLCADAEAGQLSALASRPSFALANLVDVGHLIKNGRNALVNNFIRLDGWLTNTRLLLPLDILPLTTIVPSDRMAHKVLVDLLDNPFPVTNITVLMHPDPVSHYNDWPVAKISTFSPFADSEFVVSGADVFRCRRIKGETRHVHRFHADVQSIATVFQKVLMVVDGVLHVYSASDNKFKKCGVTMTTKTPLQHIAFVFGSGNGYAGSSLGVAHCRFNDDSNLLTVSRWKATSKVIDLYCGATTMAATSTGVFTIMGKKIQRLAPLDTVAMVSACAAGDAIYAASESIVFRLDVDKKSWEPVWETEETITKVRSDGHSILVSHNNKISLLSNTGPLKEYLGLLRAVFANGGYIHKQASLQDLREATAQLKLYVDSQWHAQQQHARTCVGTSHKQGPQGCFNRVFRRALNVLLAGCEKLVDNSIEGYARCAQEDVCESVFSLVTADISTAPTHLEFGRRLPAVAQTLLQRAGEGRPLFDFDSKRQAKGYSGLQFQVERSADVTFQPSFQPRRSAKPLASAEDKDFVRNLTKMIGFVRSHRIRRRQFLGLRPRHAQIILPTDEVQVTPISTTACKGSRLPGATVRQGDILFPKGAVIGVLGVTDEGNEEFWFAKLEYEVHDDHSDVPVIWLECIYDTVYEEADSTTIALSNVVMDVSTFATRHGRGKWLMTPTVHGRLQRQLDELAQKRNEDKERQEQAADNPYQKAYTTTHRDRARRRGQAPTHHQ